MLELRGRINHPLLLRFLIESSRALIAPDGRVIVDHGWRSAPASFISG